MIVERRETDILILGAGGAGLFAALHAHKANPRLKVTIAVKGLLGKSGCTRMVQGGYNVALAPGDSVERHFMDTIEGGKWLNDQDLAWILVTQAQVRIRELENDLGCFFDRNPDGTVHQKAFAGQTFDRTVHKGDLTGIEIVNRLAEQVWARGIERLEEHRALELVRTPDGSALAGVLMLDISARRIRVRARQGRAAGHRRRADDVQVPHALGRQKSCDGLAMALRAGLPLRDMEMVQFHPTGMLAGPDTRMTGTVLEEGLRGAGGWLLGQATAARFMAELRSSAASAPRATWSAARSSTRSRKGARHRDQRRRVPPDAPSRRPTMCAGSFKGMVERCADCGFDLAGGRVEVVPTAHYMMGGVPFRADCSDRSCRRCSRPAKTPAACMAPTAWAATAWRIRPCSAGLAGASDGRNWMRGKIALRNARRSRDRGRVSREADRAVRAGKAADLEPIRETLYDDDVERGRHRARRARRSRVRAKPRSPEFDAASAGARGRRRRHRANSIITWAGLAQSQKSRRWSRKRSRAAAAARDRQPRRAFPRRPSGNRRSGHLALHGRAADGRCVADDDRAGRLRPREAGADVAQGRGRLTALKTSGVVVGRPKNSR
jgi:fumarate reductase flavoprotein subunit